MKELSSYIPKLETKMIAAEKKARKEPWKLLDVEPDWNHVKEALRNKQCPECGNKLQPLRNNKKIVMCRGKRHGDKRPYVITASAYYKLIK